jgi:homoserine kinase
MKSSIRIFAPATSANLAAGFDSLGAALAPECGTLWGDFVSVTHGSTTTLNISGEFARALPQDAQSNLAWLAKDLFQKNLASKNIPLQPMSIHLEKRLPISSGLGSSASTIVASLVAYNRFHENPLSPSEILNCAAQAEAGTSGARHFDNVAPALLGGLQLITPQEKDQLNPCIRLPFHEDWRLVIVHPSFELSTRAAREVLPQNIPLRLSVEQSQCLAGFVSGLFLSDTNIVSRCARDFIAEPNRSSLIPGYEEVKAAALSAGALFCNLSGSGPSVFAWCHFEKANAIREAMTHAFKQKEFTVRAHVCRIDTLGAREV